MRKATKTIISFAVILIAGLNFIVPAFAQDPFTAIAVGGYGGASGAGLFGSMAALSGVDIGYNSDPVNDAMWNKLNPDSVYFSGEKHEATGTGEDLYDYIDVDIGDWLDAQSDFIVNLIQEKGLTDNSSGTLESYDATIGGNPAYYNGSNRDTQQFIFDGVGYYTMGQIHCSIQIAQASPLRYSVTTIWANGSTTVHSTTETQPHFGYQFRINGAGNAYSRINWSSGIWSDFSQKTFNQLPVNTLSGDIDYQTGTINTSIFDDWESAKVKIPKSISTLQSGWTLTDFLNEINRIWSGAGEDNIIIENGGDVPPVPPVPVPDTPLGDVPFDDWVDLWGQGIYQQLENQSDALDLIGSNGEDTIEDLESIDSNLDDLNQTAESIDTNIGVGNGILGGIRSLAQSAVNYLEGIAEHVGELVEEIVEGTETLIAGILNQIPQVFSIIFGPIKQASSIWHYVVEWIQSIGAPFQFIWSMASGTSYYIILPVYASLAAAVVLAFYKRFGK